MQESFPAAMLTPDSMESSGIKNRAPASPNDHVLEDKIEYSNKTPFMAWIVLVSIMLVNAACNIMWTTCSSAPTPSAEWMQIDFDQLNWLSNACAIVNTLLSLPAGWAYEQFGIKACVSDAFILLALCHLNKFWYRFPFQGSSTWLGHGFDMQPLQLHQRKDIPSLWLAKSLVALVVLLHTSKLSLDGSKVIYC